MSTEWQHPEMQKVEVYMGNMTEDEFAEKTNLFSKRIGEKAYDAYGNPIPQECEPCHGYQLFPVFAWAWEVAQSERRYPLFA